MTKKDTRWVQTPEYLIKNPNFSFIFRNNKNIFDQVNKYKKNIKINSKNNSWKKRLFCHNLNWFIALI